MRHLFIILFTFVSATMSAQRVALGPLHSDDSPREDWLLPGDTVMTSTDTIVYGGKPKQVLEEVGSSWGLHEGVNASVNLSAFATFGSHAPHKGGFGQSLNISYLKPLTRDNRLWILAGGYLQHTNYGSDQLYDGGLYAMLNYRISPKWEAYLYGQYSLANNFDRYYNCYWGLGTYAPWGLNYGVSDVTGGMWTPGANVLGAGFRYSPTPSFSLEVNIEHAWYDNNSFHSFDRYRYPVPMP